MTGCQRFCWSLGLAVVLLSWGPAGSSPVDIPCSHAAAVCGHPAVDFAAQDRVVGGEEAPRGAYPWTAMMLYNWRQVCGGSIISDRLVVSAAHCFEGAENPKVWHVVAGAHHAFKPQPFDEQIVKVRSVTMHEDYDNMTLTNDIVLLTVDPPIRFTPTIRPICLPPSDQDVKTGDLCNVSGWGKTEGTSKEMKMNHAQVPVVDDVLCNSEQMYDGEFNANTSFCAGYTLGGVDSCQGDSGGPLACQRPDGQWFLQGIVSWGYDCADAYYPGIYTRVNKYADWLQDKMSNHTFCPLAPVG